MKRKNNKHADSQEFDELDKLAGSIAPESLQPLSARNTLLWEKARRARGRPRKSAAERSVPVQITLDPQLLKDVDDLADQVGKSRSELVADGLRSVLRRRRKAS